MMNRNVGQNIGFRPLFFLPLIGWLMMISVPIFANEQERNKVIPKISNIGFIENPPNAMKEKFPMCDAFLKVEWIDKGKKIGYSRYELYMKNGEKDKQAVLALVHLDKHFPRFNYDLSEYQGVGHPGLKKIFSIIRKGKVVFNTNFLSIRDDANFLNVQGDIEKGLDFTTTESTRDIWGETLADNRINVCIPYPDNQRMWIAEGKRIGEMYDEKTVLNISAGLKKFVPQLSSFEFSNVVDLNFDGIEDYVSGASVVYSYENKFYEIKPLWMHQDDSEYGHWSFPPTQKKCGFLLIGALYFTTDGKNYFLNNQCNLTELTTKGE